MYIPFLEIIIKNRISIVGYIFKVSKNIRHLFKQRLLNILLIDSIYRPSTSTKKKKKLKLHFSKINKCKCNKIRLKNRTYILCQIYLLGILINLSVSTDSTTNFLKLTLGQSLKLMFSLNYTLLNFY